MAVWDPTLLVGVREIDDQHRELFARIDGLLNALHDNRGKDEAVRLMSFLGEYVVDHFGAEASLMRTRRYPSMAAHLAQHDAFIATLGEIAAELKAHGPKLSLALKVNTQVGSWLRGHIMKVDHELAAYLRQAPGARPQP